MADPKGKHRQQKYPQRSKPLMKSLLVLCLFVIIIALFVQCMVAQNAAQELPAADVPPVQITVSAKMTPTPEPSLSPAPESSPTPPSSPSPTPSTEPPPKPSILPKLAPLYEQNPDLIGWLSIKGTLIDYPVMYTPENHDYYLTHNFNKKKDKNSLLVLQADCDPYAPGTNLIIHGHNMKSGRMFGTLDNYKKKAYWRKHPTIRFDTLYAQGEYAIIAVFLSKVDGKGSNAFEYDQFANTQTQSEFDVFLSNIKRLSLYDTGVEAQFGDTFITLSTCSYHTKNGRFVIAAKKIK